MDIFSIEVSNINLYILNLPHRSFIRSRNLLLSIPTLPAEQKLVICLLSSAQIKFGFCSEQHKSHKKALQSSPVFTQQLTIFVHMDLVNQLIDVF